MPADNPDQIREIREAEIRERTFGERHRHAKRSRFWRKWHRWVGFPAALFLFWAATTGVLVAITEFFGEEETQREALRSVVSTTTTATPVDLLSAPVARALKAVADSAPNTPIDRVDLQLKGPHPTVTVFTGKPTGGEDRKFVVNAGTGAVESVEVYADKPLLYRLHSGEAFGDGGLVVAMFWGLALVIMSVSGVIVYFTMHPRKPLRGLSRVFW